MEFNIDKNKVIGVIDHELGGSSVRIKVISYIEGKESPVNFSEKEAEQFFPPKGYIFEPGFFHHFKFKENDIVSFYVEENERADFGKDKYRLKVDTSEINHYGINARRISGFKKNDLATNLSLVSVQGNTSDGKFYGITDKYFVGELRVKNGKVEPALHRRIKLWDINKEIIIESNGCLKLHHSPEGEFMLLDSMNDMQLFDWFRDGLKKVDPDYVNILDRKAQWRAEIPKLFSQADKDRYEVDKVRLKRVEEKFDLINLSISDIKDFVEKSTSLRDAFTELIEKHKNEFKKGYESQLEQYQKDFEKQKAKIDEALLEVQIKKEEKEGEVITLNSETEALAKKIESLSQNKERIISDFNIIKEVLGEHTSSVSLPKKQDSFVLEKFEITEEPVTFKLSKAREQFILELKYQLSKNSIFPNLATRLVDIFSTYKAVLVKDIRLGLAFASTTKNANYIIQHVEPDWLNFSDLWNNGLGAIWQTAHKNPDKPHFLFLQDINLSSPECYARPLIDMISGVRTLIPYGKSAYPKNLKVIATKISTENPEIGLPLLEQTFNEWGAIGYNHDITQKTEDNLKSFPGIFNNNVLLSFLPNKENIEEIRYSVKSEFEKLFDE